jgi:hypothetical protein
MREFEVVEDTKNRLRYAHWFSVVRSEDWWVVTAAIHGEIFAPKVSGCAAE